MNVLVAGGAGYVGSHAVRELNLAGHHVVVYDSLVKGHKEAVPAGTPFVQGDIRNSALLDGTLEKFGIDAVMHFAADIEVGESMSDPAKYYYDNVVATFALLESMRNAGVTKMVFSSTAAVYGTPDRTPITEEAPKQPENVYGRTKLMIEEMLADYAAAYDFSYVVFRYFNAAGADPRGGIGQDYTPDTHLIPIIMRTAMGQRPFISINGTDYPTADGTCVRDFIHVTDLAVAHVLAVEHLAAGGAPRTYNLGSQSGFSVRDVINRVKRISGRDFLVKEGPRRPGDPAALVASSALAGAELGWEPKCSDLDTILRTAWEWHSTHPNGYKG